MAGLTALAFNLGAAHANRSATGPILLQGPIIASYQGVAPKRHAEFQVRPPGTWGLAWAFSCQRGQAGGLVVTENDSTSHDDPTIAASGPTGRGISWTIRDPGHQSVSIASDCPWTVRVVLPRRAG